MPARFFEAALTAASIAVMTLGATAMYANAGCSRNEAFGENTTSSAASSSASATSSSTASAASAAPIASHAPPHVEAANLTEESVTVDGLVMEKISCRSKAPLVGDGSILSALAKQQAALAKCSDEPRTVRVHFAFDDGKTGDLRVKDAPTDELRRCVADAIKAARFPGTGACALSLTVGG